MSDGDQKRRERRHREREARRKDSDGKARDKKPVKKAKGLDIIDKLDVTGIYGPGCKRAVPSNNYCSDQSI